MSIALFNQIIITFFAVLTVVFVAQPKKPGRDQWVDVFHSSTIMLATMLYIVGPEQKLFSLLFAALALILALRKASECRIKTTRSLRRPRRHAHQAV
jgi:steroid 5-alpha reductase family enzyme